ncbi:MAG: sulfite reductase subunit A [Betaproteobacteria bacterium]|nr:sulfite reductase subunit A [Betaproteobacteria bacterium]
MTILDTPPSPTPARLLDTNGVGRLLDALREGGYEVIGPTVRDRAIVYDTIGNVADLPAGWTDRQDAGQYRLERRDDHALFGYAVGPHSWKRYLQPPATTLWRARRTDDSFEVETVADEAPSRFAFVGVRACELHAMRIQDRVLDGDQEPDPVYHARRNDAFIVAVNCAQAGGTCFCVSMETGPGADGGFDICLTELVEPDRHVFVAVSGSVRGQEMLDVTEPATAGPDDVRKAEAVVERTAASMGRSLDTRGIHDLLLSNPEHPRWDDVAARCLTCANCTMVCPTCFCTSVDDLTDVSGQVAERVRRWDSCFTMEHSYLHGGSVRASARSRYRQWLTHKLATWLDQFGTSGCVGCGRCITWCPVGIDLTEEVRAIRDTQPTGTRSGGSDGRT